MEGSAICWFNNQRLAVPAQSLQLGRCSLQVCIPSATSFSHILSLVLASSEGLVMTARAGMLLCALRCTGPSYFGFHLWFDWFSLSRLCLPAIFISFP